MFSSAQIIGLAVLTLAVLAAAFILMRLDNAIVTVPLAEEDDADTAAAAAVSAPPMPAVGRKLPRSKRRARS